MRSSKSISRTAHSRISANTLASSLLAVETSGPGFVDLTRETASFVSRPAARHVVVALYVPHTPASLTIQENADPSVLDDLTTALDRLAPEDAGWTHDTEGPDDMPAHVKSLLHTTSLPVAVLNGKIA